MENFNVAIGIEIHAELNTKSKTFCGCGNQFGALPNTLVCPVCMGLPGSIPSLNKSAVEMVIMAGMLFNSRIADKTVFERKNFFYPDLPKGYQICQYTMPLCVGGKVLLENGKEVELNRIHLEEDSAKMIHDSESNLSLVDYNRCGIPIVEIVAEPTLMTSDEVVEFLSIVRRTLVLSGISDCKIEQGGFRFDISISISPTDSQKLGTRVEIINLASLKAVKPAVEYEINRQMTIVNAGEKLNQETRIWSDEFEKTYVSRPKEKVSDYRHVPDPDLKPLRITKEDIEKIKLNLPESYDKKAKRYKLLGLNNQQIEILTTENEICDLFDETLKFTHYPNEIANWIITEVLRVYNNQNKNDFLGIINAEDLATIIELIQTDKITRTNAKVLFDEVVNTGRNANTIAKELEIIGGIDDSEIEKIVHDIIINNSELYTEYKNNPSNITNFFIGQVKSLTGGRATAKQILKSLQSFKLKNKN